MTNLSIIIPNRNNPELLSRCLDSIPKREDIQIIVVDDNSDEHLVDFNKYPGYDNPNVELVFSKEGKGAGYARNVGLKYAKGKWLVFCDSDDELITDSFSRKLDEYLDSDAEIIFFDVVVVDYETNEVLSANNSYQDIIRSKKKNREELCRYKLPVPWGKMIKKTLVDSHRIEFDETPVANDSFFSLKTGYYAKTVVVDKTSIYKWFAKRKGSITSKASKEFALQHFQCSIRRNAFMYSHNVGRYHDNLFLSVPNLIRNGFSKTEAIKMVVSNSKKKYIVPDLFKVLLFFIDKCCYV